MGQSSSTEGQQRQELSKRYILEKIKLGEGTYGRVFRAVDRTNGQVVAIKQLNKEQLRRRTGAHPEDNVEKEVAMMSACRHDNILLLLGTFQDLCHLYLALEFCEGGDLDNKVILRRLQCSPKTVATWARQMCSAVAALHGKRICHRDIKPHNFLMTSTDTESSKLKLSDFGLAVFLPKGNLLSEKCGTPAYMSPELRLLPKGSPGYGHPNDVWALGICIVQLCQGGRHPFIDSVGGLNEEALLGGHLNFETEDTRSLGSLVTLLLLHSPSDAFCKEAQGLCSKMVAVDPRSRETAANALNSQWLRSHTPTKATVMLPEAAIRAGPGLRSPSPLPAVPNERHQIGLTVPQTIISVISPHHHQSIAKAYSSRPSGEHSQTGYAKVTPRVARSIPVPIMTNPGVVLPEQIVFEDVPLEKPLPNLLQSWNLPDGFTLQLEAPQHFRSAMPRMAPVRHDL